MNESRVIDGVIHRKTTTHSFMPGVLVDFAKLDEVIEYAKTIGGQVVFKNPDTGLYGHCAAHWTLLARFAPREIVWRA